MENVIVLLIVGAAAAWIVRRALRPRKTSACAGGCSGCGSADKPQGLVQLKR